MDCKKHSQGYLHTCQIVGLKVRLLLRTGKWLDVMDVAQPQKTVREKELEVSRKKKGITA